MSQGRTPETASATTGGEGVAVRASREGAQGAGNALNVDSGQMVPCSSRDHCEIQLSRGLVALVDAADFEWLSQWKWRARRSSHAEYAVTLIAKKNVGMHRLLLPTAHPLEVDHINCNTLDNRRANLRIATRAQNGANRDIPPGRSGFRGVYWVEGRNRWRAQITVDCRNWTIGHFVNAVEVAKARDAAALKEYGEFARLNFPRPA